MQLSVLGLKTVMWLCRPDTVSVPSAQFNAGFVNMEPMKADFERAVGNSRELAKLVTKILDVLKNKLGEEAPMPGSPGADAGASRGRARTGAGAGAGAAAGGRGGRGGGGAMGMGEGEPAAAAEKEGVAEEGEEEGRPKRPKGGKCKWPCLV